MEAASIEISVRTVNREAREVRVDRVAVEAPFAIRVEGRELVLTMRTPGDDAELAVGLLFGEGIVATASDVRSITPVGEGVVDVTLAPSCAVPWERFARGFVATSACGVCGKASADTLRPARSAAVDLAARDPATFDTRVFHGLPAALGCSASGSRYPELLWATPPKR